MRFEANQQTLPRLHLIGTLAIVTLLTVLLGVFFTWRSTVDHRASLERVAQAVSKQQQARLQTELDAAVGYMEFARSRADDVLQANLRQQVDMAWQVAQAIYATESPRRPDAEVRHLIIEALRPLRFFDGRGYYFINDMSGRVLLMPIMPNLEGQPVRDVQDDTGHYIIRGLIEAARSPEESGFSRYRYFTPDSRSVMTDKLAYVRHFAPFDWMIGSGDYAYKWEQQQQQEVIARLRGVTFGQSGHISLMDASGQSLITHRMAKLVAEPTDKVPPEQKAVLDQLLSKARHGGGVVHYQWSDTQGLPVDWTALVKRVEPWGWTLVVSMTDDELQSTLQQELWHKDSVVDRVSQWLVPLALALLLGVAASYAFAFWSRQLFASYHEDIRVKNQTIADSAALFRAVFENAAVGIAQISREGQIMQINSSFCKFLGYSCEEVLAEGFRLVAVTPAADVEPAQQLISQLLTGQDTHCRLEQRYIRKDGTIVWGDLAMFLMREPDGTPLYFVAAVHDITERKRNEDRLQLAASVFTHAREGIMITEMDGTLVDVNDSFTRITGYERDEVLGQNPRILRSGMQSEETYAEMWRSVKEKGHFYGEFWNRQKSGDIYAVAQTISVVRDANGQAQHYVSLFSDITALKEHERQLEHIAHFDALTNLPNRVLLADRLSQAMLQAQRRGQILAVAYLDLDGFKSINDQHGHDVGDRVLMVVASRMKDTLREGDTLARIGGDEFVAVLVDLPDTTACQPLLTRLLVAAAQPIMLSDASLQVSASVGVTYFPQSDTIDADQLQRQADQAMYQAKLAGKNRFHVFDDVQDRSARGHFESLERIRLAIQNNELVLYYQPKVNMRSGMVIGAEALIRWQHPERGLLAPAQFLPVIENHPLAVDVGEWVIHTALSQMEIWQSQGLHLPVSVNVGARQLQQPDFVARLQSELVTHPDIAANCLQMEVLETSALEDIAGVSRVMEACRELGVMFSLDDFGTGYSSLTYLKRLPVNLLKIDQSFVRDMLDDVDDLAILKGVIGLAQAFRREVIAEGVETVAHGTALLQLGCELAQGYGIARPMPASELPVWAANWRPDAAWQAQSATNAEDAM